MFNINLIVNDIKKIKERHIIELKKATNSVPKSFGKHILPFLIPKVVLLYLESKKVKKKT